MAKAEGPQKHFRGRNGDLVYYQVKGVTYVRNHVPHKEGKKPSSLQLYTRQKFKEVVSFVKPLKIPLDFGFQSHVSGMKTGFNIACGWAMKNCFTGGLEDHKLEPSLFKVSAGRLTGPEQATASWLDEGQVEIAWKDNTGTGSAKGDDQLMAVLYHVQEGVLFFELQGNFRREERQVIRVSHPEVHRGKLHVYLAFSRQISRNRGSELSDSLYLGLL